MLDSLKQLFIRPPRQSHYPFDLGPSCFYQNGFLCTREDFTLANNKNNQLSACLFRREHTPSTNCVIYLHTHHGSKLQSLPLCHPLLDLGINFCSFDFAGYGNSQGQTVSLGYRQAQDIDCVINHLSTVYNQKKFILWGRSMGAVSALLYLHKDRNKRVIGAVYDSPFDSLETLAKEIGGVLINMPQLVVEPLVYLAKKLLVEDIDFQKLEIRDLVHNICCPGLFITSRKDRFVQSGHVERLYAKYGGRKEVIYIDRDHNQNRSSEDLQYVYEFIRKLHHAHPKMLRVILQNNILLNQRNAKCNIKKIKL